MSAQLTIRDAPNDGDADGNLTIRFENNIGSCVTAVSLLTNGAAHPGVYTLDFNTPGPSVDITPDSTKNPYNLTGVGFSASTTDPDVLPGVSITFGATINNGDQTFIVIGDYLDDVTKTTSARLNAGLVTAGNNSAERYLSAVNTGDEDGADSSVHALPGFYVTSGGTVADIDDFIENLRNHPHPTYEDAAGEDDLAITFANYSAGSPDTVDVLVDGNTAITAGKMDGQTEYGKNLGDEYDDTNDYLEGLAITLPNNPGDPTAKSFTIHVRKGYELVEFDTDNGAGGPSGTWAAGPLTLTESGETTGVITSGGNAFFHMRFVVGESEAPGAMRLVRFRARTKSI